MKKERFDVTGMSCSACSSHVENNVSKVEGVEKVSVNLLTNSMQVEFDEQKINTGTIIKAVEDAGYGASVKSSQALLGSAAGSGTAERTTGEREAALLQRKNIQNMKRRLIVSLIFWIPLMYFSRFIPLSPSVAIVLSALSTIFLATRA